MKIGRAEAKNRYELYRTLGLDSGGGDVHFLYKKGDPELPHNTIFLPSEDLWCIAIIRDVYVMNVVMESDIDGLLYIDAIVERDTHSDRTVVVYEFEIVGEDTIRWINYSPFHELKVFLEVTFLEFWRNQTAEQVILGDIK